MDLFHQIDEIAEQVMRVMRARCSFGMILDAEHRMMAMPETFQRLIVQIDDG